MGRSPGQLLLSLTRDSRTGYDLDNNGRETHSDRAHGWRSGIARGNGDQTSGGQWDPPSRRNRDRYPARSSMRRDGCCGSGSARAAPDGVTFQHPCGAPLAPTNDTPRPSTTESPRAALKRERREAKWRLVGKPEPIYALTAGDVNRIHWALVEDFRKSKDPISPPRASVTSPCSSPPSFAPRRRWEIIENTPTVAMATAALFHALVQNHPFHNGNKRTALVSLLVMLDRNGYVVRATEDELYDYVLAVAQHDLALDDRSGPSPTDQEMQSIAVWIQATIRKVERRERRVKWRAIETILHSFDCECDVLPGNRIRITQGEAIHTRLLHRRRTRGRAQHRA